MKKIKYLLTITVLLTAACASPEIKGKTYALIYGVSGYSRYGTDLRLNASDLKACRYDAESFAAALKVLYGPSAEIYLRTEPIDGMSGTEKQPSKQQILSDFEMIRSATGSEDRFIFFYAGHGMAMKASEVDAKDQGEYGETAATHIQREYLCPAIDRTLPSGDISLKNVLFSDRELREELISLSCKRKFVFLDSCHSAGMITAYPDVNASILHAFSHSAMSVALKAYFSENKSEKEAHKNTWILVAAGENGNSYESTTIGHGFFTYSLLKGFGEADSNRDKFVSWSELTAYAAEYSRRMLKEVDSSGNSRQFGDMLVSCGSGSEDVLFAPAVRLDKSIY